MRFALALVAATLLLAGCHTQRLPEACTLKPESGRCKAAFMRYWYDPPVGTCKAFIWGGCGGVVPFETMESCAAQCMPGQPVPESPVQKATVPAAPADSAAPGAP